MIDVKIIKRPKNGGTPQTGGIATNGNGYITGGMAQEATHAKQADLATLAQDATHAKQADLATLAQEATHAQTALDLDPGSPVRKQFLSRIADDVASGHITFEQGLTAVALAVFQDGAHFGEFIKSMHAGKGAGIDKDGNAEFETVRARSYFEAMEYVVNRLAAIEGDQVLTEGDTIDRVVDNGDGTYGLYLRSKWDGYFTAQVKNNVLKGIINTLAAGSGQYYTCWLRINNVDAERNYIEVAMYPDDETPAGKNYPPCELMKIARWGNQTDTSRQNCLYLSSTEGRIVKLTGVTKPIIDKSNYGATFGSVPDFLKAMRLPLIDGQDYVYARGLIVEDIIRIDYQGRPVVTYVDRGQWSNTANYYCESVNPNTGIYETSDVWYMGCKYRCLKNGTHNRPAWNNTDWALLGDNPEFAVEFVEPDYLFDPDKFETELTVVVWHNNIDITSEISATDVTWVRYSEDAQGNQRALADQEWFARRYKSGKFLRLSANDIEFDGYIPKVRFTAIVTISNNTTNLQAQVTRDIQFIRKGEKGDPGEKGEPGEKGDRGPSLRGPQEWINCNTAAYQFQSGAPGEQWVDVVIYNGNYYYCTKSHTKLLDNYPQSAVDQAEGYWRLGDKIDLVATKILLASYALVKNLGVECIDMKDTAGNILFQVKDGNVLCRTGTFENIKVSGDLTAESLNLKISTADHFSSAPAPANGSICIQGDGLVLPELPAGTARSIRILNPVRSRVPATNLVLEPANKNVFISRTLSEMDAVNAVVTLNGCGAQSGRYFELIGIGYDHGTYWLLSEMKSGLNE